MAFGLSLTTLFVYFPTVEIYLMVYAILHQLQLRSVNKIVDILLPPFSPFFHLFVASALCAFSLRLNIKGTNAVICSEYV